HRPTDQGGVGTARRPGRGYRWLGTDDRTTLPHRRQDRASPHALWPRPRLSVHRGATLRRQDRHRQARTAAVSEELVMSTTRTEPTENSARTLNAARRLGFRLLPGDGFSYILHLRPREWPIMAAHTAVG